MKMKKIVCMLLLIQSGFLMAQTETLVTPNGKKVKVFTNPLITANNGLRTENGNVELGGALLKPTTILTNSENTLTIDGLQVGADTDNILVADANGVLKWVTRASIGDNMGDHTATQTLKMGLYKINNGVDVNDWGLGFSNRDKDYMVRVENASLKVEILPDYRINSLEEAKELKLVTVDNGGNPLGMTSFEDAINKAKEYFIIPSQDLSDIHSKDGFPNQTITLGQLVYNTNDAMENGSGKGLYYWGILQDGNVGWIAATKDNLGNHIATQTLDMGDNPINDGGGNWGLKFEKGEVDFDPETKDFLNSNRARFGGSFVVIDHLPNLKPNDPSEKLPKGFEFVTQNISGEILRSTSLNEVMDAAQNQYFMPKISLADNIVGHAVANLLQQPKEGQFVYNTNPDMQSGKGIGIYYNQDDYWIPLANATPGDNLGNHIADKDLDMNTKNISNATNVAASGTVTAANLTATTKTITPAVQITTGAGAGKIAVSDASGNLVWTNASLEGLLVDTKTVGIAGYVETPYTLNASTTLSNSKQSVRVDKLSRIIISGAVVIGAKSNTMGSGYIIVKKNGAEIYGFGSIVKYSVLNPLLNATADIDPNASLTTTVSYEAIIDDVEPGTYEFSVDINPTWSAPVTTGTNYTPEHYCPGKSYLTYKVYNK